MSTDYIPLPLQRRVRDRASNRCEYCAISQAGQEAHLSCGSCSAPSGWWHDDLGESRARVRVLFAAQGSANGRTGLPNDSRAPGVGKIYPHPGAKVQRLLMRATRNHVYYVERDRDLLVVAV